MFETFVEICQADLVDNQTGQKFHDTANGLHNIVINDEYRKYSQHDLRT